MDIHLHISQYRVVLELGVDQSLIMQARSEAPAKSDIAFQAGTQVCLYLPAVERYWWPGESAKLAHLHIACDIQHDGMHFETL